jgi:hypothetical protein
MAQSLVPRPVFSTCNFIFEARTCLGGSDYESVDPIDLSGTEIEELLHLIVHKQITHMKTLTDYHGSLDHLTPFVR